MDSEVINVEIGDYAVIKCPGRILSNALGSCVAIVLYDERNKIGALAHVMLPCAPKNQEIKKPGKYANTAVQTMISEMKKLGTNRNGRIRAKLIGGAHMFKKNPEDGKSIGNRNVEFAREALKNTKIKLSKEETGGNCARNVTLDTDNGKVIISNADGHRMVI